MTEDRFKNRKEALDWLQQRGQISQGKFYEDCSRGYIEHDGRQIALTVHPDKSISKFQIMLYAEAVLGFTRQSISALDLAERKEKLDVRERELKVDKLVREKELADRELHKDWKHRDESEEEIAGVLGMLLDAFDHQLYKGAPELIQVCNGDISRVDEVYATTRMLLSTAVREVLAEGSIEGVFETIGEGEDDL